MTRAHASEILVATSPRSRLRSRRLWVTLLLGISSGLPLALLGSTLQAWYTDAGVSIVSIGALSLIGQPYVFKFLWARLVDLFQVPGFGLRRGWIFVMQLGLAALFIIMSYLNPAMSPFLIAMIALAAATLSATQDIAVDAYRNDLLPVEEHGIGAGLYTAGARFAAYFSGGFALILAAWFGWQSTFILMGVCMLLLSIVTLMAPRITPPEREPMTFSNIMIEPFKVLLAKKSAWLLLIFIVIYKLGDAFALQLTTTFLLRGVGFSLVDVGTVYKMVGLIATILGALVGGYFTSRLCLFKSLFIFGAMQGFSTAAFIVLAIVGKSYSVMAGTIFLEFFSCGLATSAFLALLMGMCDAHYNATQFALLTALSAIGRVFIGPAAGLMVAKYGWISYYTLGVILSLPGLILLWFLRDAVIAIGDRQRQVRAHDYTD